MNRSSPTKRLAQARAGWSDDLSEAAKAGGKVSIACRQEDHTALRLEASKIGDAEDRDVAVEITQPRLVSVTFTPRQPRG